MGVVIYDHAAMVSLYACGLSQEKIAAQIGCSRKTVGNALVKAGVSVPPKRVQDEVISELYASGMSHRQIANHLGCARASVGNALTRAGVAARSFKDAIFLSCNSKGRRIDKQGYVLIRVGPGIWRMEHQIIAESVLGRSLKPKEVVHHINGDKSDNRKINLLICSASYHQRLHLKIRYSTKTKGE